MKRLGGKVCIVTGAAKGIGNAITKKFVKEGAAVVVSDIDQLGREVAKEIGANGGIATFVKADISKVADVKRLVGETIEKYGKIDVLINNAGISGGIANGLEIEDDDWKNIIDINLTGLHLCTKYAGMEMKKRGCGSIVNMSSILGIVGCPISTPYSASKGGVRT